MRAKASRMRAKANSVKITMLNIRKLYLYMLLSVKSASLLENDARETLMYRLKLGGH